MTRTFQTTDQRPTATFDARAAAIGIGHRAADRAEAEDVDGGFPQADLSDLYEAGLLLAPFPKDMGGISLGSPPTDPTLLLDVLVAIGRGSLSLGRLYEGHVNAVKLVARYGDRHNLDLLRQEGQAGRPSGVWMAEMGEPLRLQDVDGIRRLQGRKVLASGAGHFRRPLVAAQSPEGSIMVIPFIEDTTRCDASCWTTLGMRATATGTVDFTGIAIDATEIVGKPDDYMRSPLFRGGAWRVIAVQLGGVEAIMHLFKAHLPKSPDALQLARYGEALIAAETARLWVGKACRIAEAPTDDLASVDAYVDLARNAFEQAALRVIATVQKTIGLRAFLRPNPLERIIRDLSTYMRQPALDASLRSAASFHLTNDGDSAT